jgi:2-oxoglutarate ferredoxin oxidoreductase subunit delta
LRDPPRETGFSVDAQKRPLLLCDTAKYQDLSMAKIIIDESRCKGCALCTIACSRQLIRLSKTLNRQGFLVAELVEDGEAQCSSCALCAQLCPDVAISVYRENKSA